MPHPYLVPVKPRLSRSTQRRGVDGSTSTITRFAFTLKVILIALSVNAKRVMVDVDPSTPLLWVLRDNLGLTGTKYGCGMAQCGACTVHIDGQAVRSCVAPVSRAA